MQDQKDPSMRHPRQILYLLIHLVMLAVSAGSSFAEDPAALPFTQLHISPPASVRGDVFFEETFAGSAGFSFNYANLIVDGRSFSKSCYGSTCYYGPTSMALSHGNHNYSYSVFGNSTWYSVPGGTVSVDRTPYITTTSPNPGGTYKDDFAVIGSVAFSPTYSPSGTIKLFIDNASTPYLQKNCYSDTCGFTFSTSLSHGPHTLKLTAEANGGSTEKTIDIIQDRTPEITIGSPLESVGQTYNVLATITRPEARQYDGYVKAYIDGVETYYNVCSQRTCTINTQTQTTTGGIHTVKILDYNLGNTSTIEKQYHVDELLPVNNPPDTKAEACLLSTVNTITGALHHDQNLFATSGGPLTTEFSLYYDNRDEISIRQGYGSGLTYRLPLGQGWTHSYDISLFLNASGSIALQIPGEPRRFFTPNSAGYTGQPGETATLTKNTDGSYILAEQDNQIYRFTNKGILTSFSDRHNNTVTVSPIVAGKSTITDPQGKVTTLTYDSYGEKITTITDPAGKVYDFAYDTNGLLTKVTYPAPDASSPRPFWDYTYTFSRLMETKTDPEGNLTRYEFDSAHQVKSATGPDGKIKKIAVGDQSTTYTLENGADRLYTFDRLNGIITGIAEPDGGTVTYEYNTDNRVSTEIRRVKDDIYYVLGYLYDTHGNVTDIQGHTRHAGDPPVDDAVDLHVGYTYDYANNDQLASVTNYLDDPPTTATMTRDVVDGLRRTIATDSAGNQTVVRQNSNGTVADFTYPAGVTESYSYDTKGALLFSIDTNGVKTEFSDRNGLGYPQTIKVYDATGALRSTVTLEYDALGRITKSTTAGTTPYVTSFGYNKNGYQTSVTDANGKLTNYAVNYRGQTTKITDALLKDTLIEYSGCATCGSGDATAVVDANGNRTAWEYDTVGRLAKETDPLNKAVRYTYYPSGQLKEKILDTTNQVLVSYQYDGQGRISRKDYLDGGWATFTYTPGGRLWTAANQNISYTFGYDTAGQLTSTTDSNGRVVAYSYLHGQRQAMTVLPGTADQHVVSYGLDTKGRLSTIASDKAGTFTYGYDTLGRRESLSYPNGVTDTYTYHPEQIGWLAGVSYAGTLPVYSVTYSTFDMVGNRTGKTEGTDSASYGYDAVYRLLTVSGAQTETFTYDDTGNRLTEAAKIYTIGTGNQVLTVDGVPRTYDDLGNTLTAGPWAYTWLSTGELTQAINGSTSVTFKYDPFGRRIEKSVNGTATTYLYDGEDIAASFTGGTTTHFVHGPGTDEHLALVNRGIPYFYHSDGLGSITRITDSAQVVVQSYAYSSFGTPFIGNPSYDQPYLFNGREFDPETSLSYHRARYLNPSDGRWMSRDPASFSGGDVNLYGFVGNQPVNFIDFSGLVRLSFKEMQRLVHDNNMSGLSDTLILAIAWKESRYDTEARSYDPKSSATGLMQITKYAIKDVKGFSHCEMTDAEKNIQAGSKYIGIRVKWAKGNTKKALDGYGTGPGYSDNILKAKECLDNNGGESCLNLIGK